MQSLQLALVRAFDFLDLSHGHGHEFEFNGFQFESGLSLMGLGRDEDLYFTSPMSLSPDTYGEVRALLLAAIEEVSKKVAPSPSESVACLSIDLFDFALPPGKK